MAEKILSQKETFKSSEGDNYYGRNKLKFGEALRTWENDPVIRAISNLNLHPESILEIGCGNGWRLEILARKCQAKCFGIDPSGEAIKEGMRSFPDLLLNQATADAIPYGDRFFDLVICGFCLYLCDRRDLFKIAYEVDRVLQDYSALMILDFYPPFPYRNTYAHRPGIFSFKMKYADLFTWNPDYFVMYHQTFAHPMEKIDLPDERVSVTMLQKDVRRAYPNSPTWEVEH